MSERIKHKIWDEEFLDLRVLGTNFVDDNVSFHVTRGLIQLHHGQASKTPLSIEQWTTCFNVFIAIYILKSPAEAGNLLKYAATIRELHSNHGDLAWRQYDEGFRRLRQSHRPPWQKPIDELYTKAANRRPTVQSAVTSQAGGRRYGDNNSHNRPFRNRVCFAYNRGETCPNPCRFRHTCQVCGAASHPKTKCFKLLHQRPVAQHAKKPNTPNSSTA